MIPVSYSNLASTSGRRAARHTQLAQLETNPDHRCSQTPNAVPLRSAGAKFGTSTIGPDPESSVIFPSGEVSAAASPTMTSLLQQPARGRAPPPSVRSAERRRRLPSKRTSHTGKMRTRHPSARSWLRKEQEAKGGAGQVPTVAFSLKRVHSVASNNAVFAALLRLLCMTAQFGGSAGSDLNSGVPTCRRKLGERVWQLLQFPIGTTPSSARDSQRNHTFMGLPLRSSMTGCSQCL